MLKNLIYLLLLCQQFFFAAVLLGESVISLPYKIVILCIVRMVILKFRGLILTDNMIYVIILLHGLLKIRFHCFVYYRQEPLPRLFC